MTAGPRVLRPDEMFPAGVGGVSTRFVTTASGLRIRVAEAGDASGRKLLALHGWGCSLYAFRFLLRPLAELGYRIIAADFKGHGLSDKPVDAAEYTLASMTDHALAIADAIGAESFDVIGHSMGGRIGIEMTRRSPERAGKLFLISPVGFGAMPHITYARPISNKVFLNLLPVPLPTWLVRMPIAAVYGGAGNFTAADIQEYRAPTQFREFLLASMHLLREFDWKKLDPALLANLRARTWIIAGQLDRVVRIARSGLDRSLLEAGWRIRVVQGVAHVPHEESPGDIVRMIADAQK